MSIRGLTAGSFVSTTGNTTLSPGRPGRANTIKSGMGILMAVCSIKSNASISTATIGWTKLFQSNNGANFTQAIFIAPASASAPVFTWSGSVAGMASVVCYESTEDPIETTVVGTDSVNTGTGTAHSTTGFNTTRINSAVAYVDTTDVGYTATGTPSGWTEITDDGSSGAGLSYGTGWKSLPVLASASGNINITGANGNWIQRQIEIIIQNAAAGIQISGVENVAVLLPPPGLVVPVVEVCAVLVSGTPPPAPSGRRRQIVIVN